MDCAKSLELLSEYRAGALDTTHRDGVSSHLSLCTTCDEVFRDLDTIVQAAAALRDEVDISFPDERTLWQRMVTEKKITIH
ncbi:MAG: hypothetical protein LC754_01260 [Acidobacteria bacterium]|nr:hypothetical protein [Acidobacteriota bacterium]